MSISARSQTAIAVAVFAISVAWYLGWEWFFRGVHQYASMYYDISDADEWRYAACSDLVRHGYTLFSQVFSAQPPVLFVSLAAGEKVLGDTLTGSRLVEVLYGLVTLGASAWLAFRLSGRWAMAAAVGLLAVSPGFLIYSHTIEAEGPMMALATLSLALLVEYDVRSNRMWLVVAGLSLAAAVLTKLFAIEIAAPALIWIMTAVRPRRRIATDAILFGASAGIPVVAELVLVSPGSQWAQVVAMHDQAATLAFPGLDPPYQIILQFFELDGGLALLALAGLVGLAIAGSWRFLAFFAAWLGGQALMLLLFQPLFPHHPIILLASLAVCAGVGVALAAERYLTCHRLVGLPVLLAACGYAILLPHLARADRHTLYDGVAAPTTRLAAFVDAHTAASDFVAADDLSVTVEAHRLAPPGLCDPSNVRLRTGYLTAPDLIANTVRYRPRLVLFSFGIFKQVPGYTSWLNSHYHFASGPNGSLTWWRR